jgi:hypothetical protein
LSFSPGVRFSPPRVPRFQPRHTATPFNSASDAYELHPDNASDRRLTVLKAGASGNPAAAERGGCDLADVGAPSVAAYVDRWRKRASWKKAFFTTSEYGAHHLMAMTTMMMMAADALDGAFYLTLVPIRPRRRGERRSLRSFSPGVSLRPHHPFNPRPRRLSTSSTDAFELHPDFAL